MHKSNNGCIHWLTDRSWNIWLKIVEIHATEATELTACVIVLKVRARIDLRWRLVLQPRCLNDIQRWQVLYVVESNMQSQVRFEYNNTALPRNATNTSVLRTTAFWDAMQIKVGYIVATDLHIYILDTVPPIHVAWNYVATGKLTTANGGTFTSSSASLSKKSR